MIAVKTPIEHGFSRRDPCTSGIVLRPVSPASESGAARQRMQLQRGEPLFLADWMRVLMLHFEVDADRLQRDVAYLLDLYKGRALVTLVAFAMENMHPRVGGKLGEWLIRPIASHSFLNVRTYVRHRGEPGIHFLAEWLSSWLAVQLGPRTFGLPYRHGRIRYEHDWEHGALSGRVMDVGSRAWFRYQGETVPGTPLVHCEPGSPGHWLMERYTAFNSAGGRKKFFRVWHPPWPQFAVNVSVPEKSLLTSSWPWFADARLVSCNFSPGLRGVWMGRPHSA
jgi:uncharacterized protein YqjF (DUF2071 family)